MRKLLLILLISSMAWGAATRRNWNNGATNGSSNTATVSATINAVGDLVVATAWCYPGCTAVSVTMGAQTFTQTTVSGVVDTLNNPGTGQERIFYLLSSNVSGAQTITWTVSGSHTDIQVGYIEYSCGAGCTFTHDIDSPLGSCIVVSTGCTGTVNAPSITPSGAGELLFGFTVSSEHVENINAPWGCPIYSGGGQTGTCQYTNTQNVAADILSSSSGATANNTTTIHPDDSWQALLTSFIMTTQVANACPTGNQTIQADGTPSTIANVGITGPITGGITTCWYASQSSGSDSNSGTTEASPWKHVPGMSGCTATCAAHTPVAHDGFILKGGDTWTATTDMNGLVVLWSGTSTHPIYWGVDQSWFSGASWTRPKFSGNSVTTNNMFHLVNESWVIVDNIEATGMRQNINGCQNSGGSNVRCTQLYFHGWSWLNTVGSNNVGFFAQMGVGSMVDHNVVDGSDSTKNTFNGVFSSDAGTVQFNEFNFVVSGFLGTAFNVNSNIVENGVVSADADHCNGIFTFAPATGSTTWIYNNIVRGMQCGGGVNFWLNGANLPSGCGSCTANAFNNIIEASAVSGNVFNIGDHPGAAMGTYNVYNNTIIALNGGTCMGNGESPPRSTTNFGNNHCINTSTQCDGTGTTCTSQGGNISQTLAVANGQGYTSAQTDIYSPKATCTVGTCATLNAGVNQTAKCTGNVTSLCTSVIYPVYNSTNHTMGTSILAPAGQSRGSTWDTGAYEFNASVPQAAAPSLSPSAGTFTTGQLITPSTTSPGAIICTTINGTTPQTDSNAGCITGTLLTSYLSIGSTTTVKAVAGGSGYADSAVSTGTFTINSFNADNLYCPAGTPTWGTVDGPATLPQTCYNTLLANTPATGSVVNVSTAGQLNTALAAAACGQKITLLAGNTFSGHFTIPAISCPANNYLWIQSSAVASLPAEGARYSTTYNGTTIYAPEMGACYSGITSQLGRPSLFCPSTPGTYTAKIVTPDTLPALTFTTGTSGVRIIGLEFARTDGAGFTTQIIKLGNVGTIDHVIFDRLYCHGNENIDETSSCINLSAVSNVAVIDSYMPNFFCAAGVGHASCDAHALWGGGNNINNTPENTIKVVNNFLEGAAETIEWGGVQANVVPTDFEVRNNFMFKPLQWDPADPSYQGLDGPGGQQIVKNLYEHKTGQRVLVEGNMMINNWAQAQDGSAILLVAKNQTGNLCPICAVEDITVRYNYISTASAPFALVPTSATDGQLFAAQNDISVHDNVGDNMMYPNCYNCGTPTPGAFQIESIYTINTPARVYRNLTINHNTVVHSSTAVLTFYASVWVGGPTIASGLNNTNLVFKNNVFMGGSSGVLNTPGNGHPTNCANNLAGADTMLNACYSPITFTNNCILAHGSVTWPSGQLFVATQTAAYANYNNGDNGDYTIAAGACKGAATDGSDPGANLPTLASVLIGNNPVSRQDIPATYFGLHWKIANFPPLVPSGSVRLWDSLTRWQLLNPSNGIYSFANLDTNLQDAKTLGVDVLFTLSTTPNFTLGAGNISSDPTNATCNYNSTANGGCGVPTDIAASCTNVNGAHNCDGKTDGTNQTWRNFIYNTVNHILGLDPAVYQYPSTYEIWNEFTQQGTSGAGTCAQVGGTSWEGTCAQLVRMYSDANCIISGRGTGCTAGAMGVPAVGLAPTAVVTTPDSVMTAPQSTQWGAYLGTAGALTNADVAAVHAYTQNGTCSPCAQPETVVTRYTTANNLLTAAGGTQPIWSTEGGWGTVASENDVDLQAAFVARYYLLGWNAGFKRLYWYSYDSSFGTLWTSGGGLTKAGVAYGQIYGWMVGSVFTTPCTAVSTVYSCVLTNATGDHLVMWDTSQTCSGGVCTTANQNVASTWLAYQDMTTQSIPIAIAASHQVPIGAKPVIFQQSIVSHGAGVNPVILGMNRGPK